MELISGAQFDNPNFGVTLAILRLDVDETDYVISGCTVVTQILSAALRDGVLNERRDPAAWDDLLFSTVAGSKTLGSLRSPIYNGQEVELYMAVVNQMSPTTKIEKSVVNCTLQDLSVSVAIKHGVMNETLATFGCAELEPNTLQGWTLRLPVQFPVATDETQLVFKVTATRTVLINGKNELRQIQLTKVYSIHVHDPLVIHHKVLRTSEFKLFTELTLRYKLSPMNITSISTGPKPLVVTAIMHDGRNLLYPESTIPSERKPLGLNTALSTYALTHPLTVNKSTEPNLYTIHYRIGSQEASYEHRFAWDRKTLDMIADVQTRLFAKIHALPERVNKLEPFTVKLSVESNAPEPDTGELLLAPDADAKHHFIGLFPIKTRRGEVIKLDMVALATGWNMLPAFSVIKVNEAVAASKLTPQQMYLCV